MLDKNIFDPKKMTLIDFKIIKGQMDTPESFDINKVVGHQLENSLQLGFNLEDKMVKADFNISIKTDCKEANTNEATGNYHLLFIYRIENLEELAIPSNNNKIVLDPSLGNALSSVTYSTSRGVLLERMQGTALRNFILPIINPNSLLQNKD